MSLRLRIALAMGAVAVVAVVLVGVVSSRATHRGFSQLIALEEEASREDGGAHLASLGKEFEELYAASRGFDGAEERLRVTVEAGERIGGALFSPDGQMLAAVGDIPSTVHAEIRPGHRVAVQWRAEGDNEEGLFALVGGVPILGPGGQPVAYLLLLPKREDHEGMQRRDAILGTTDRWLIGGGLLVCGLAVVLAWLLSRQIVRPIRTLAAAARELGGGDLARRVAIRGGDEIADLGGAFNAMATDLERLDGLRRQLVSDVAHELRTPLTALRVQLEAIEDGLLATTPDTVASLSEEVTQLARLVDDLQELALAEAGQLRLDPQILTVGDEVEGAARSLGLGPDHKPHLGGGLFDLEVWADPQRFHQILTNLLDNARLHAPNATVTIEGEAVGDWIVLEIRDDGPGVAPQHLPNLFERFYRVDPARQRATGGIGLGLAITRQLVELHDGTIEATSEVGKGTTFRIAMPRSSPDQPSRRVGDQRLRGAGSAD